MYLPKLTEQAAKRQVTDAFYGYNHNMRIRDGEFYDMQNLSSSDFPLLSVRGPRGTVSTLTDPQGIAVKDAIAYVDGDTLYYNGNAVNGITLSTDADMCPKQMVSMGAYLVIWPDKVYVNTKSLSDCGSLEATFSTVANADVTYSLCRADGVQYDMESVTVSPTAPEEPGNGDLWMDTSGDTHALKQYSEASSMWVQVTTVYVRIGCTNIGKQFAKYDGVAISGIAYSGENEALGKQLAALNTTGVLYDRGDDYIVVVGILDQAYTQQSGSVTVARKAPKLDYITECGNRIWGCFYGMHDGKVINEIYACKLGDFKNWNCFMGISTDSYTVSLGSDGVFTGAATFQSTPLFFKEGCVHRITGNLPSSFQVLTTNCRGVQDGSWRSVAVVNETLYYKSPTDICAFDGSLPVGMSAALGDEMYFSAVGGAYGKKYYVSMCDGQGAYSLFVLDIDRGIWHREDSTRALMFARSGRELFYIDEPTGRLMAVNGTQGTAETAVSWRAESGVIGYEYPDQKTLSRFDLRMQLASTGSLQVFLEYDSSGSWEDAGTIGAASGNAGKLRTFLLPIVPRRCDHVRMKLQGTGEMKLFSIARILEIGSDGGL